jgi:hypothetical protein
MPWKGIGFKLQLARVIAQTAPIAVMKTHIKRRKDIGEVGWAT